MSFEAIVCFFPSTSVFCNTQDLPRVERGAALLLISHDKVINTNAAPQQVIIIITCCIKNYNPSNISAIT